MQTSQKPRSSPPWQLIAILAVTIIPIVAAYVAYFTGVGVPDEHVNNGKLLEPARSLEDVLADADGDLPEFGGENRVWRLVVPVPYPCNQTCQNHLYLTRQVHIRLGEKAERVERYAVNLGGKAGEDYLTEIADEHPRLKRLSVAGKQWQNWLAETNAPQNVDAEPYYLLVDQVGFAMMYYDRSNDGNQLLKDIKRVLRFSPE